MFFTFVSYKGKIKYFGSELRKTITLPDSGSLIERYFGLDPYSCNHYRFHNDKLELTIKRFDEDKKPLLEWIKKFITRPEFKRIKEETLKNSMSGTEIRYFYQDLGLLEIAAKIHPDAVARLEIELPDFILKLIKKKLPHYRKGKYERKLKKTSKAS